MLRIDGFRDSFCHSSLGAVAFARSPWSGDKGAGLASSAKCSFVGTAIKAPFLVVHSKFGTDTKTQTLA